MHQWRDAKIIKEGMGKQRKVIAVLKDIKEKSRLDVDFYPVGEIPDLCTPKMYEALHDHIDRSYVIGPPQFTPGYLKNLLAGMRHPFVCLENSRQCCLRLLIFHFTRCRTPPARP
jgi:hypothetical protein